MFWGIEWGMGHGFESRLRSGDGDWVLGVDERGTSCVLRQKKRRRSISKVMVARLVSHMLKKSQTIEARAIGEGVDEGI